MAGAAAPMAAASANCDLALNISASQPVIFGGDDNSIFWTVSNVATTPTTGATITLNLGTAQSAPTATPSLLSLPTGWTLVSQTGQTYVFSTTNILAPGSSATFVMNYLTDVIVPPAIIFIGSIQEAGGCDANTSNNSDSLQIPVIMN